MKEEAVIELYINPPSCPACNGTGPQTLGTLGSVAWMRCRDCGWDFKLEDQE